MAHILDRFSTGGIPDEIMLQHTWLYTITANLSRATIITGNSNLSTFDPISRLWGRVFHDLIDNMSK
jgi:hypothetical protein